MNQTPHCPHCGFGESQDVEEICLECETDVNLTINHCTFAEWFNAASAHGFGGGHETGYDLWIAGADPKHEGEQYHRPGGDGHPMSEHYMGTEEDCNG